MESGLMYRVMKTYGGVEVKIHIFLTWNYMEEMYQIHLMCLYHKLTKFRCLFPSLRSRSRSIVGLEVMEERKLFAHTGN
jgi:hypothetical protein